MDPTTAKREVRARMREVRRSIASDPDDRAVRSARIWLAVVDALGLDTASTRRADAGRIERIMMFDSLPGEPDTSAWMAWCSDRGLAILVPDVDGAALRVVPGDLDPARLDAVVVPGLAFTADGRRLGQGGGHYDRFLLRLRPGCATVGVGFAEQLVDDLPVEPHDVRLQHVVTDAPLP